MLTYFYDIESVSNVFTLANWRTQDNVLELYILLDDPMAVTGQNHLGGYVANAIRQKVYQANKNFNGEIRIYDLREMTANRRLAATFGLTDAGRINDSSSKSSYPDEFRLVCDTDPDYDPDKHPYLFGYNSQNFDTTLLTVYLYTVFRPCIDANGKPTKQVMFTPTTAREMRAVDNELFSDTFNKNMPMYLARQWDYSEHVYKEADYKNPRWKIRKNMLMSGRHVDVARLNEKQQHVGLKRIIGMLGGQILESDKLSDNQPVENLEQLADLLAYNASDVINLDKVVFQHKTYKSNFALKKSLLQTYPELVYSKKPNEYAPDIRPEAVRNDRLFIDSSSAQLATKALCPYNHLKDIPVVSFMYPSEAKAKELGIPRRNILDECDQFFKRLFHQPELRAEWARIYNYYKSIEGKNYNESENYLADYPHGSADHHPPMKLSAIPKANTCLFYYDQNGQPTSCFAVFSTGGIHGAEYNKVKYDADLAAWKKSMDLMAKCQAMYPDPIDLKKAKTITIDGVEYKASEFLKSGSTMTKASYKDVASRKPQLFVCDSDGNWSLNTGTNGYAYTSADPTNHEDFTSYYPNLLRMMSAFYNIGLGYDRYAEIFQNKQDYGFLMKAKNANLTPELSAKYKKLREAAAANIPGLTIDPLVISDQERAAYDTLRDGTKLILNSASGAADANFESSIRMNNQIISMRIIGQLFSWRIAQAQTYQGAKITSTNTDGLYSVLEATRNAQILKQESDDIHVEIEPEPTFLISKDTNNRIEMDESTRTIQSASGGTLGCRNGPNPTKALSHPAIIDWALAEYLVKVAMGDHGLSLADPFSEKLGREILMQSYQEFDRRKWLNMFQNIIASSPGTIAYIFALKDQAPDDVIILQHYNRVFIMKDDTPGTVHLFKAMAKKIPDKTIIKRQQNNERTQKHDPVARQVLTVNGVRVDKLSQNKEAVVTKCTNIEAEWCMYIQNAALENISDAEAQFILDRLDIEKYLTLLNNAYTRSWMNKIPGHNPVYYQDTPGTAQIPAPVTA